MTHPLLSRRCAGVLLHPTSLPGQGVGTVGAPAHRFIHWLAGAGQALWQTLPLVPTGETGSPYNGLSAMAGNPLLLDLEPLVRDGLLEAADLRGDEFSAARVDYPTVSRWKGELLRRAYLAFRGGAAPHLWVPFREFRERQASWLGDFALFQALREHFGGRPWTEWDLPIRVREPDAVRTWTDTLAGSIQRHAWEQFLFNHQWQALRSYAHEQGIRIIGDIPIFVALDSADVWAHRELFQLDAAGQPTAVAGVPPDYFSETGQRWGNPLYRWDLMEAQGFHWWTERFRRTFELVDIARIDHFRGFDAFWAVPAEEETALHGEWCPGPGAALFKAVERELGPLPLIAEDLGLITPEVERLRDSLGLPGMRVLQFAFDGDANNPHHPANHLANAVAYTGTHDNDTIVGWWGEVEDEVRDRARDVARPENGEIYWAMVRLAFESPANLVLVPLQDLLGLGSEARMNTPGTGAGNWKWRFTGEELSAELQERLREITRESSRLLPLLSRKRDPSSLRKRS